ncbi:MAG: hypothetical protein KJ904_01125 [Alphaproteobacteria bacterium]|nr:hypothetical protein [Alphaproteobacteria bacterium]MBU0795847.1 hypothetical protein [Alphaproteobacteria bacterium]MBU0885745.1 hypothetical protein [Alphaproteobacteria bacterium]MBU1814448.1 hypothetical protein [Alphaproteobacteria bacterium]
MFGLSFSKLLVLAAVIAGVWFFFRMVTKLERSRRELARGEPRARATESGGLGDLFRRRPSAQKTAAREPETEDMRACPACGTFVSVRGARDCGRELCPYGA